MTLKKCPWCSNSISMNLLGKRPAKIYYKWYQFSSSVKVCPYCANPVKPSGSIAKKFVYLIAPIFALLIVEMFFNTVIANYWYIKNISWVLAGIGFLGFYWFYEFEKVEEP